MSLDVAIKTTMVHMYMKYVASAHCSWYLQWMQLSMKVSPICQIKHLRMYIYVHKCIHFIMYVCILVVMDQHNIHTYICILCWSIFKTFIFNFYS